MLVEVRALRHLPLLVGIAVREQPPLFVDHQREPVAADADAIDEAPEFFEAQLSHQIADDAPRLIDADRDHRARQQVVVDLDRRDQRRRARLLGRDVSTSSGFARRLDTTGVPSGSNSVSSRKSGNVST